MKPIRVKFRPKPEYANDPDNWEKVARRVEVPFRDLKENVREVKSPDWCDKSFSFVTHKGEWFVHCNDNREGRTGWFYIQADLEIVPPTLMVSFILLLHNLYPDWLFPIVGKVQEAIKSS